MSKKHKSQIIISASKYKFMRCNLFRQSIYIYVCKYSKILHVPGRQLQKNPVRRGVHTPFMHGLGVHTEMFTSNG